MPSTAASLRFFCPGRWLFTALLLSLLTFLPARAEARDLVLGFVAGECQLFYTTDQAEKFADYLSGHLNRPVRIRTFKDQKNLHHWMNRFREVDLAVFSSDYMGEKGRGSFIPLSEFLLQSSEDYGKGMVVGRRGLAPAVFVKVKQCLLAAAADSSAAGLLSSLEVASFVLPRQPQVEYARILPRPLTARRADSSRKQTESIKEPSSSPLEVASTVQVASQTVEVEILSPKDGGTTGPQPLLQYYLKNARATITLDGKILNKGPGDRLGPLTDGRHELIFEIASPLQPVQIRRIAFSVDARPPDLSVDQHSPVVSSTVATVSGKREDDVLIRVLGGDGESAGSLEFPDSSSWVVQLSQLQPGANRFEVVARDNFGNEQRQTVVLELDATPPAVAIIAPADGAIVSGIPALAFSADEGEIMVLVDGEAVEDVNRALEGLEDGSHLVVVRVRDAAGNLGEASSSFRLDRSGPGLTVEPVAAVFGSRQATLRGTRDADSNLAFSLEPSTLSVELVYPDATSWQMDLDHLIEGENVISLQARDAAGNITSENVVLSVDLTAPVVMISSPVAESVHATAPLIDYQAEAEFVQVLLDGVELNLPSGTPLPEMTEGPHSLVVTATDEAGNTGAARIAFAVDRSAPDLQLVSPVEGLSNEPNPLFEILGEDEFQLYLDEKPISLKSGERLGPLVEGEHHLRLVAIDAAGNRLEIERLLIVDTTPPGWEILSGTEAASTSTRELVGRREPASDLEFSAETARIESVVYPSEDSWKVRIADLSEGENLIKVTARDAAGNSRSGDIRLLLDSKPPELTLESPLPDQVYNRSPELSYRVNEGEVQFKLNARDIELSSGQALPELADGRHLLLIQVTDEVGNQTVQVVPFFLDRQGPSLDVMPLPVATNTEVLDLHGKSDPDVTLRVVSDGGEELCAVELEEAGTWVCTSEPLAEGPLQLTVLATDSAGNESRLNLQTLIDRTPPKLSWRTPQPGSYRQLDRIDYLLDEGVLTLLLDGEEIAADLDFATRELADGPHQIEALAIDPAGNQSRQIITFTIDSQAPVVRLSQPPELVSVSEPVISFVSTEGAVKVLLDGSPLEIEAGERLPVLAEGEHRVRVEATDAAGNLGFDEKIFRVDTTRPELSLNGQPGTVNSEKVSLEGQADPDAVVTASFKGQELSVERLVEGGWRLIVEDLEEGANLLLLQATDQAGLTSELQLDLIRDSTAPEVLIESPQAGQAYNSSPILSFKADEGVVIVRLNAQELVLDSGQVLPAMEDGEHQVQVEVTDAAGNRAQTMVGFRIDQQGPNLMAEPLPEAFKNEFLLLKGNSEPGASVRVVNVRGEDVCPVEIQQSGAWACTVGPFEEGPLQLTVLAVDQAGNQSHLELQSTVDRTPPTLDWRAPKPGTYDRIEKFDYVLSEGILELLIDGQGHDPAGPLPELPDGVHQIEARAVDAAGNQTRQIFALTIDRQAPLVVISQPGMLVTDAQPMLSFVADVPEVDIFLDDRLLELKAGERFPPLVDGEYRLRIEARDEAGNLGFSERIFHVDTTRPEFALAAEPGPVTGEQVLLEGTVEAGATLTAEYSGQSLSVERPSPEVWSLQVAGLKEGTNQVVVKATDTAGLQTALNIQVVRDSQAPALVLLSPQPQAYGTDRPSLEYQADLPPDQLEITLDGVVINVGEDRLLGPLVDGDHHLLIKGWDLAGNLSEVESHFSIDTSPPVFLVDPLPEVISHSTFTLSGTREPGSFIDLLPFAGATVSMPHYPAENLWEIELNDVPDGEHELHLSARDRHGNTGSQQLTLSVDSLQPTVRILSPTAGLVNDPAPQLIIEGEGGELEISLNGEPVGLDAAHLGPLMDDDYVLLVTETDEAGNVGEARVSFRVDTTPPRIDLISPAKGDRTSTTPILAYNVTGGEVRVQLDGRDIEVSSGQPLPQLSEGDHVLRLTASDEAGNVATSQAEFNVDGSAPQVILLSPASGLTPDTTPFLQFRVDRGEVRILVDGEEVDKRSGASLDPLTEGEHLIRVEAQDETGNTGYAERRLIVSLARPEILTSGNLGDRFSEFSIAARPAEVDADYSGEIELRIGPLRHPGETVYIEQWIDANGNGVADSGEQVARVFKLVDGLPSPSQKVPGDLDSHADRMILVRLSLDQLHRPGDASVQYVLLAMSPSDVAEATFRVIP